MTTPERSIASATAAASVPARALATLALVVSLVSGLAQTAVAQPTNAQPATAQPIAERFATCAACHGAGGVSTLPDTPSLAGQHSFYAITQLFLFRAGRRGNAAMSAVAAGMSDADLRAYSDFIGKLPPAPPTGAAPRDDAKMRAGAALADKHLCSSCHGIDYAGEKQTPRLAAQREDYLLKTLVEFKAGQRIGYTSAMNEVLAGVAAAELPALAHYLAHVGP